MTDALPPLDSLPRQSPPPSDEELAKAYVPGISVAGYPPALLLAIVVELAVVAFLLLLILLAQ